MDLVLEYADEYVLDAVYPLDVPRDAISRQITSISILTLVGGYFLYLTGAGFAYRFLFDKELMKHPKFKTNQVWMEIAFAMKSIPIMMLLTLPLFLAEVRGCSKTYTEFGKFGYAYEAWSVVWLIVFSDMLIYWIHRWLHHPLIYATLHKPHHKWIISTPFASHAFHPLDGYAQGLPYHIFIMLFPIHRGVFLALFVAINYWTISIHDGFFLSHNGIINGALHHSVHHEQFVYNYGQYFTLWDRLGGSYREPPRTGYSVPKQHTDIKTQETKKLS
ncbi:Lathosterol oxidase [Phytophthora boehmeriae]|uniref:Lathosterol oxidase n=1 Tax=Phytophthora boehmeriae TaxID=109152 RepID=A0A8T1X070_9STRA|nr:Lathosterol oxidase [Phytophthora boehmeriae]